MYGESSIEYLVQQLQKIRDFLSFVVAPNLELHSFEESPRTKRHLFRANHRPDSKK